jgi:hypothetical protein
VIGQEHGGLRLHADCRRPDHDAGPRRSVRPNGGAPLRLCGEKVTGRCRAIAIGVGVSERSARTGDWPPGHQRTSSRTRISQCRPRLDAFFLPDQRNREPEGWHDNYLVGQKAAWAEGAGSRRGADRGR